LKGWRSAYEITDARYSVFHAPEHREQFIAFELYDRRIPKPQRAHLLDQARYLATTIAQTDSGSLQDAWSCC